MAKLPMHASPRCGAKTRAGHPCRLGGMKNGRCQMHGGKSTGAPKGNKNGWKHGNRSAETTEMRRQMRALIRGARELVEAI